MNKSLIRRIAALAAAGLMLTACGETGGGTEDNVSTEGEAAVSAESSSAAENTETKSEPEPEFNDLSAEEITAEMGMGWNLGNQLEASSNKVPNETAWGNPVITEDLIKAVKDQGFNTIRIPVSYLSKIGEAPDYTVDEKWLDRIGEVVDYAVDNDMYTIVNMHGDGYYTVDGGWLLCAEDAEAQTEIKAKYEAVWKQIAEKFKDYDEHLIFESMNEEFNNDYGKPDAEAYANINDYNRIFTDTVRSTGSNNTKRWLLIPGWNTNIDYTVGDYGFEIPEDSKCDADGKRLMISVHYYDPYNFTLEENITSCKSQWGKYATEDFDNWGQEDYVDAQMKKLNDTFVSKGYPVVIGEMGAVDRSTYKEKNAGYRRYWYEYVVKASKANGAIPVYWDNGWDGKNGFALFDRTACTPLHPEIIEALMRAINSDKDYEIVF